jgi:hypothetical protein
MRQVQELANIRVYPGTSSDFTLYRDDGRAYACEKVKMCRAYGARTVLGNRCPSPAGWADVWRSALTGLKAQTASSKNISTTGLQNSRPPFDFAQGRLSTSLRSGPTARRDRRDDNSYFGRMRVSKKNCHPDNKVTNSRDDKGSVPLKSAASGRTFNAEYGDNSGDQVNTELSSPTEA